MLIDCCLVESIEEIQECEVPEEMTAVDPIGCGVHNWDSLNLGELAASPSAPTAVTYSKGMTTEELESQI